MGRRPKPLTEKDLKHIKTKKEDLATIVSNLQIEALKYHYTMEKDYKFTDHSRSILRFTNGGQELEIFNSKPTH